MNNFEIGNMALRRMIDHATDNCIAREQRLRDAFVEANKDSDASVIQERDAMMANVKLGVYSLMMELLREIERLEKIAG